MANAKLSDLAAISGADIAATDLLYLVDVSATTSGSKKITVAEWWKQLSADVADVTKYGATGDGSTDDSDAIQAAVAAAVSSGHYRVFLPAGTYIITETITIPSYVEFFGVGPKTIIKMADTGEGDLTAYSVPYNSGTPPTLVALLATDQTDRTTGIYLHDFAIDGNGANIQTADYYVSFAGVLAWKTDYFTMARVNIADCNHLFSPSGRSERSFCLLILDAICAAVRGGVFGAAGYESIGIRGASTLNTVIDGVAVVKSESTTYGWHGLQVAASGDADPRQGTRIVNSTFSGRAAHIINHSGENVTIANCTFRIPEHPSAIGYGIIVRDNAINTVIDNCHVLGGASGNLHGVFCDGSSTEYPQHCVISNCSIRVPGECVAIRGGKYITVRDCNLYAYGLRTIYVEVDDSAPIEDLVIEGNVCETTVIGSATPVAVRLGNTTRAIIRANNLFPKAGYHAVAIIGSTEVLVRDNNITVSGAGKGIFESGTVSWAASGNVGYVDANSGTATVDNGATYEDVTHGLGFTPTSGEIVVTPTNNLGDASHYWISDIGATTFRINVDSDPGATTATFAWRADRPLIRA